MDSCNNLRINILGEIFQEIIEDVICNHFCSVSMINIKVAFRNRLDNIYHNAYLLHRCLRDSPVVQSATYKR